MYLIKGHIISLLYLCPFHVIFHCTYFVKYIVSYVCGNKNKIQKNTTALYSCRAIFNDLIYFWIEFLANETPLAGAR